MKARLTMTTATRETELQTKPEPEPSPSGRSESSWWSTGAESGSDEEEAFLFGEEDSGHEAKASGSRRAFFGALVFGLTLAVAALISTGSSGGIGGIRGTEVIGKDNTEDYYDDTTDEEPLSNFFLDLLQADGGVEPKSIASLPRTLPDVEYNDVKLDLSEQYFLYSPSGGWGNQLMCLLNGLAVAQEYNLTLIVPPVGMHANFATGYYVQNASSTVPMDQVLDLAYMSRAFKVKMVPLGNGMTLRKFHEEVLGGGRRNNKLVTYPKWKGRMSQLSVPDFRHVRAQIVQATTVRWKRTPVIFCKGHFYSTRFYKYFMRGYVRYAPFFKKIALTVAEDAFKFKFNAMHLRLGDYESRAFDKGDSSGFVKEGLHHGMTRDRPVYVATDGTLRDEAGALTPWFEPLGVFDRIVTMHDLPLFPRVKELLLQYARAMPSNPKLLMDVFGMVEQLICMLGKTFVGTAISTFTKVITSSRSYIITTFPEVHDLVDELGWTRGSQVTVTYSGRLSSHSHTGNISKTETTLPWGTP